MRISNFVFLFWFILLLSCNKITLYGRVLNEKLQPVAGATITLKRTGFKTSTNQAGEFMISKTHLWDTIICSAAGYRRTEETNNKNGLIMVILTK